MIPIQKLKSRNLTLGQRGWLRWKLWHLGWRHEESPLHAYAHSCHHTLWYPPGTKSMSLAFLSLLSAAKAAGIKYVPTI